MPCAATWPNGASATRPETTVTPASTSTPNPSTGTSSPAIATGRGGGMVIGGGSTGTLTRARLPSGARSVDVGPRTPTVGKLGSRTWNGRAGQTQNST